MPSRDGHAAVFAVLMLATVAIFAMVGTPPVGAQIAVAAPLIALLGVPHGALDPALARRRFALRDPARRAGFAALYLAVALAVVAAWVAAPVAALAAFLAYAALHFGDDWRDAAPGPARRLLAGGAAILAPFLGGAAQAADVFAVLAGPQGRAVADICKAMAPFWVAATLAATLWPRPGRATLEIGCLAALGLLVPPLVYFTVYFCALHAPRHFLVNARALGLDLRAAARAAAPATLVTVAAGLAYVAWADAAPGDAALRAVFIGLAALTAPHMLIVEAVGAVAARRRPV